MAAFGGALSGSFGEPASTDTTSLPQMQVQVPTQAQPVQPLQNPVAKLMKASGQQKKKQRNPAPLAAAIARSHSARPSSRKYG